MKKLMFVLLAGGIAAACGTRPEATLDATVTGVADGTKVYLLDNARAKLDSAVVAGGKFRFEFAKAYPDQNYLIFDGVGKRIPFVVEPGAIVANIDPAGAATFTGTPTNDEIKTLNDGADSSTERSKLLTAYMAGSRSYELTTPAEVDSVLTLIAGAPANAFTDRLRERRDLLAASAVGVEAPDFTQAQPDGTPLSLSSLRGKLVLIDFWASWCGPCRRENPNVVKLYNRFKENGFEILGVSLDEDREKWLEAIAADGLTWKHVSDLKYWQNAVAEQYAVKSIPHTVLVGADGAIIAKNLRGAALEAKVAEVLTGEKMEVPSTAK